MISISTGWLKESTLIKDTKALTTHENLLSTKQWIQKSSFF
jgi:uncharacterized SAM-binding protein YcdF (DUF218 family)